MEKLVAHWSNNNFIFFGKLIIIALYFTGYIKNLGTIDLPLINVLENESGSQNSFYVWHTLFFISSLFIFMNKRPKLFMFINGLLLFAGLLLNPMNYAHNMVFSACLFITFSISNKTINYVPIQLAIVYFGAFIDKLVFVEWRNGDFMTAFFQNYNIEFFKMLSSYINANSLILILTYGTLIVEFALIILVLIPKTRYLFIVIGLWFHFASSIIMSNFFSMFIIALLVSYFALFKTTINFNETPDLSRLFIKLKAIFKSYKMKNEVWFSFDFNDQTFTNYYAFLLSIILNPITVILTIIVLSRSSLPAKQLLFLAMVLLITSLTIFNKLRQSRKGEIE